MKKLLLTTIILLMLTISACGSASTTSPQADSAQPTFSMPEATQLIIGTFKLEGTDNAVTAEQAAQLIPLWQVYKDLSTSSAASQEEVTALVDQIHGTMTAQQTQAITDLNLTMQDVFATMQELGIAPANRVNPSGTPRPNGGPGPGGNFQPGPNGVPAGGGPGGNNGQNISPEQIATFQARRAQGGGSGEQFNRVSPELFDALIKLLQDKK
jgi:hypothetical protein